MKIAVVGLGIIGGSFAKALKKYTKHYVIGLNRTQSVLENALADNAIDEIGTVESLGDADIIILGLYPKAAVDFVRKNGGYIKKGAIVTDSSGIKREICPQLKALSERGVSNIVTTGFARVEAHEGVVLAFLFWGRR